MTNNGIYSILSTNGWLINKENAQKLYKSRVNAVILSLDHSDQVRHDEIRTQGSYAQVLNAIQILQDVGIETRLSTVILKDNYEDLENIYKLASCLGVKEISLKRFRSVGNGEKNIKKHALYVSELEAAKKTIKSLQNIQGNSINVTFIPSDFQMEDSPGCQCGKTSLAMRPSGDIAMCDFGWKILGNILNDDLRDIWTNHEYLVKNRIQHVCESPMAENAEYTLFAKVLLQKTAEIPREISLFDSINEKIFVPSYADEIVMVIFSNGQELHLNVVSALILEAILEGSTSAQIQRKLSNIFPDLTEELAYSDIKKTIEQYLQLKIITQKN